MHGWVDVGAKGFYSFKHHLGRKNIGDKLLNGHDK